MYPPWRNDGVEKGHCVNVNHFYFKRIFVYSMWSVVKVFIECVTMLLLFDILVYFRHRECGIFSSPDRGIETAPLAREGGVLQPQGKLFLRLFLSILITKLRESVYISDLSGCLGFLCSLNLSPQAEVQPGWPWNS